MTNTILFQGITPDDHLSAVRHVLELTSPEEVIISVAYVKQRSLLALRDALAPVAERTTIFAGIRNGITSAQALRRGLALGCSIYAVDTGSRTIIFHPKIYFSRSATEARLLVGSANLTVGGLTSNIEASVLLNLELHRGDDMALVAQLLDQIHEMLETYPDHVFPVPDDAVIETLFDSGRLVDESTVLGPTTSGSSHRPDLDTVPRMNLRTSTILKPPVKLFREPSSTHGYPPPAAVLLPAWERWAFVWKSNPLDRRHLTIPTGSNTNPTGSMLFTKGAVEDIDQRHYFRDTVFAELDWHFDARPSHAHMERAEARFQFVIRDIAHPTFTLRLSHNSRTDTTAYKQHNSMTQIHWGPARGIIAREDLLDRTLSLYRDTTQADLFLIEID